MGFNRFDFLSNAPKNFIFRNTSNKTNFGGILFLLYIFVVALIATIYLCDFFTDEDYSVEYTHNSKILDQNTAELKLKDDRYNPYFDFMFEFHYIKENREYKLNDSFKLINMTNDQTIQLETISKAKVSDIDIMVVVDRNYPYEVPESLCVNIYYHGFKLDHQNNTSPLYQLNGEDEWLRNSWMFRDDNPVISAATWRLVKYKEDIGFLKLWNKLNNIDEESQKIIGLKYNSKVDEYNPGPGQYETNNYNNIIFKKLPDIILGKANRFSSNINDSPGPGRYNSVDLGKYNKLNPSWKMGTSERKSLGSITDSPGPGRYDLRKNLGENSPQYSMGKREKDSDNKFVSPGPGRYNNDEFNTYKRYPAWKMGTGKRDDDLRRQIREGFPGPGAYKYNDLYLQSYPKYKFGTEERVKDKNNGIPGPGSYHIPCSIVDVNSYTREQGVFDDKFKFI